MRRFLVACMMTVACCVSVWAQEPQAPAAVSTPAADLTWRELRRFKVPAEYPTVPSVVLSADGARVGYVARWFAETSSAGTSSFEGRAALFIDGAKYSTDSYAIFAPVFSPDGRHVAYTTVTPVDNKITANGRQLFLDQKPLAARPSPDAPVFSPDGARLAYLVDTSASIFKPMLGLFIDGTLFSDAAERFMPMSFSDDFEMDAEPIVSFSPDGKAIAFTAKRGKKCAVMVNDKSIAPELDMVGPPKFAPDGRVAYQAKAKGDWSIMVGQARATATFDKIGKPVWSRDGRSLAYRAKTGRGWAVFLNTTRVSPELDKIGPIAVSHDGQRVAYPARVDKKWTVFIQDRRLPAEFQIPKLGYDGIRALTLNADGSRVVYKYESFQNDAQRYLGVATKSYLMVNETKVTADFTVLDYVVVGGRTIVVAGHDGASHEIVVGSLEF
jgi:roadblock/LC7 domain-containing protein